MAKAIMAPNSARIVPGPEEFSCWAYPSGVLGRICYPARRGGRDSYTDSFRLDHGHAQLVLGLGADRRADRILHQAANLEIRVLVVATEVSEMECFETRVTVLPAVIAMLKVFCRLAATRKVAPVPSPCAWKIAPATMMMAPSVATEAA